MNLALGTRPAPDPATTTPAARATPARPRRNVVRVVGPAFVAAVAFVDPGNFATNTVAGADYRYALLWVVVVAGATAMLVQYLSAKLGLATGQSLAEVCRERCGTPVRIGLWLVAEAVVITTDLAEFVGGAIALDILFGVPPVIGGAIVALATLLILQLRVRGRDAFPAVVIGLLAAITLAFGYLVIRTPVHAGAVAGGLLPGLDDHRAVLLACGILGATVMPHALFLHSSLASGFGHARAGRPGRRALRFLRRDVVLAMGLAGAVNALILIVAAGLPAGSGASLNSVHAAFAHVRGQSFAAVFALALLASGLASACAGVYTGQTIMQGFLHRRSSVWLRRVVSAAPALAILALVGDPTDALVLSQVALAFGLPFALVPLLVFTARHSVMGRFANRTTTTALGVIVTGAVVTLNAVVLAPLLGPT